MFSFFLYSAFSPSSPFKYTKQSTPFYNMRQQRSSEFIFCFVMCICTNYQTILCLGRRITRVQSVGTEKPCSSSRTQRRRRRRWDCTTSVLILSATTGGRSSGCTIYLLLSILCSVLPKYKLIYLQKRWPTPRDTDVERETCSLVPTRRRELSISPPISRTTRSEIL